MISAEYIYSYIDSIRSKGRYVTNFYLSSSLLNQYLKNNILEFLVFEDECLLFKDEKSFYRLYFVALNDELFKNGAAVIKSKSADKPVLADIILPMESLQAVPMKNGGFSLYSFHLKMVRESLAPVSGSLPEFAENSDFHTIEQMLNDDFDPLKEHLPTSDEIKEAIRNQRIIVLKEGGKMSFLYFLEHGVVSELKYLLVHAGHRGKGFSRILLESYFGFNKNVKHFSLWVEAANYKAQNIYLKNGYKYSSPCNFTFNSNPS
jgi:GNAT superfamily N-acetyltransferase